MVNEVQTINFGTIDVSDTTFKQYSATRARGFIEAIDVTANLVGSLWIGESGTNYPLAFISMTSGTNSTFERVYPKAAAETTAGIALSGTSLMAWEEPFVQGYPIIVSGLGVVSGTTHDIGLQIHWRPF